MICGRRAGLAALWILGAIATTPVGIAQSIASPRTADSTDACECENRTTVIYSGEVSPLAVFETQIAATKTGALEPSVSRRASDTSGTSKATVFDFHPEQVRLSHYLLQDGGSAQAEIIVRNVSTNEITDFVLRSLSPHVSVRYDEATHTLPPLSDLPAEVALEQDYIGIDSHLALLFAQGDLNGCAIGALMGVGVNSREDQAFDGDRLRRSLQRDIAWAPARLEFRVSAEDPAKRVERTMRIISTGAGPIEKLRLGTSDPRLEGFVLPPDSGFSRDLLVLLTPDGLTDTSQHVVITLRGAIDGRSFSQVLPVVIMSD